MAKKNKEVDLVDAGRRTELAGRAFALRLEGQPVAEIAERLGISGMEAGELCRVAYARLAAQTADELRTEVEGRLDYVLRRLNVDLALADSQLSRNGIYALILKTEAQRSHLLGLAIPAGTPDA